MQKTIMITGGLGFIGSHLAQHFVLQNNEVKIVSRSQNANYHKMKDLPGVTILLKSITDLTLQDIENVDVVFHLASTVHNYHILDDPFIDCKTNVIGTSQLLNLVRQFKNIELILGSSWFVYGHQHILPVSEDAKCEPLALYGATKLCSEHYLKAYASVFDLSYKIVRFGNVYGLDDINSNKQKGALLYLLKCIKNSETVNLYYGGDFIRDYIFVEDAVKGMVHVAANGFNGETYNVASGTATRFKEIVDFAVRYFESNSRLVSVEPPAFHKAVQTKNFYMNVNKLKSIGFNAQTSIMEGLRHVCQGID